MVRHAGDRSPAGAVLSRAAVAEVDAFRAQCAGLAALAPELGPVAVGVGALTVLGVRGWPDHPWANAVVGLGAALPVREPELDEALALLSELGARAPYLTAEERAAPRLLLPQWLAARGLTAPTRLVRLLAPTRDPGGRSHLRVVVAGPELAEDVVRVCEQGFGPGPELWWRAALGRPGWTQVLAYDGAEPIATAALHVNGETAYAGAATTVPRARGRGAHAALVAARLRLAGQQGARHVAAKASPGSVSQRNLERAGFCALGAVVQWRRPAPAAPAGRRGT